MALNAAPVMPASLAHAHTHEEYCTVTNSVLYQ